MIKNKDDFCREWLCKFCVCFIRKCNLLYIYVYVLIFLFSVDYVWLCDVNNKVLNENYL